MKTELWENIKRPPPNALKTIKAGRLKGMSDISPIWRAYALTEQFGPCGVGWTFEVTKTWTEAVSKDEVLAFANINLYIKHIDGWSYPIPGNGGSKMTAKESAGLHNSDECFKMAITDALSTAMKMLGVGADVYYGAFDGSKYVEKSFESPTELMTTEQAGVIKDRCDKEGIDPKAFAEEFGISRTESTKKDADRFIKTLDSKVLQYIGAPD